MSNEIVPMHANDIIVGSDSTVPMTFTQTGNNGTQIGHADMVKAEIHVNLMGSMQPDGTINRTSRQLSHEYYSLFVLGGSESFNTLEGSFVVRNDRVLESPYTDKAIRDTFIYMTDADRETIMSYPALFMTENHNYGRTDESQMAYWGRVTGISPHGQDTKVKYQLYRNIPQQIINGLSERLCLLVANCFNELNRTHWAIKRVDLLEELSEAHIDIL